MANMNSTEKYSMSFTTGGLFLQESPCAAELYLKLKDWKKVREVILSENLLQLRTKSSGMRVSRELCNRLCGLDNEELKILIDGHSQDRAAVLWLAACRQYRFIYEFAVEVLAGKFLAYQRELFHADFDACFNAKAAWHEELDRITDSTLAKLRQVLFRMMHEAGLLSSDGVIQTFPLSPLVISTIKKRSAGDLSVFPVAAADIKGCLA